MRVAVVVCLLAGCSFETGVRPLPAQVDDADVPMMIDASEPQMIDAEEQACVTPPSGLIAWWPGDTAAEIIGNHTSVLVNGAQAGTTGKVGGAFELDGINDRIDVQTDLPALTEFTIEGWVDFGTVTSSWRTVFGNDNAGPGFWMKDRRINWFQSGSDRFISNVTISSTGWHHFALVYGADHNLRGFVDGEAAGMAQYANAFLPGGATIGGLTGYQFDGQIDELSIYNRGLTETEIDAIVAAGANGKCQ